MRNMCIAADYSQLKWKESKYAKRAVLRKIKYELDHGIFLSKEIQVSTKNMHITAEK